MYFVTLGQFQLYRLRNSDEDWVNNAQPLMFRVKQTGRLRKTWKEVVDKQCWVKYFLKIF